MILDANGQQYRAEGRLSLDAINEVAMNQIRRDLDETMFRPIVQLYGPDGKMIYCDFGFKGLQDALNAPAFQQNLIYEPVGRMSDSS